MAVQLARMVLRRAAQLLLIVLIAGTMLGAAIAFGVIDLGPDFRVPWAGAGAPGSAPGAPGPLGVAPGATPPSIPTFAPIPSGADGDPVVVVAGDIADCARPGDAETAAIIAATTAASVIAAGDLAYPSGTTSEFRACYAPTWGRFKDRTRPVPGNRDWVSDLDGYRDYWGSRATGPGGSTWYSWDLGAWHVVMLDSNCDEVGGCSETSKQGRWLAADLRASKARCTLAVWHHPRFSSGEHGDYSRASWFWDATYAAGGDVVVSGHDHDYERFEPLGPTGTRDEKKGIREFVVGTGGGDLQPFGDAHVASATRIVQTYGVLRLVLHPTSYAWEFITGDGIVLDTGSSTCH